MRKNRLYAAIALVGVLLVGFIATSLTSYYVAQDSISDRIAEETLPLTSDNIYSEIERDLLRSILISSLMAHDTFVRDWVLAGEQEPVRIVRYLDQIQEKYDTTTAFFVSEKSRRYYHPLGVINIVDRDDPGDAWYFRVRDMKDPYEINIDRDTADPSRVSIFVNYRVTDGDGRFLGAIGIGLAIDSVTSLIESYEARYGREIYFVDREGAVTLAGQQFSGDYSLRQREGIGRFATRILSNPSTNFEFERADGTTVYVNSRLLPELDWHLIVTQADAGPGERLTNTLIANILFAVAVALVVALIAYVLLRGQHRRLEELATVDRLTGATSRQVFDIVYEHVIRGAHRREEAVSVLAIDIDHFKALNDAYGHHGGDVVIREFVGVVRGQLREGDTLCRWGGDEFIALLPGCDGEAARALALRMRDAVRTTPITFGREGIKVTASIGVAEVRANDALEDVIRRADGALYESKQRGRDGVSGPAPQPA